MPDVVNPRRKALCKYNLLLFLQSYFPYSTGLSPFSPDHVDFIDNLEVAILQGGEVARAVFRGFSKTTIGELSCVWALLYGHKRFVPLVGGDLKASANNLRSIKTELETNPLLLADFPEVCFPIQALEGKVQRTHSQTYQGEQTRIQYTSDKLVLPTIPGSPASSGCVVTLSITAFRRGLVHKDADGTQHRPDFVFIDDPQTNRSAISETQVDEREHTLKASILKSAGHGQTMSVFVAGTIIAPGDLMDRLTDKDLYPGWNAKRVPMVQSWANKHETHWLEQYANIRKDFDRDTPGDSLRAAKKANKFYFENREEMDAGCVVAWRSCYNPETEHSAIQHAYNMLIDDGEAVFASECQNEPIKERGDLERIEPRDLAKKTAPYDRGEIPDKCHTITAYVDVQATALYYMVVAWEKNFTGYIVDYGVWPEPKGGSLALSRVSPAWHKKYPAKDRNAATYAALVDLFETKLGGQYTRGDGSLVRLSAAGVDVGYHESAEAVRSFCKEARQGFPVLPGRGHGITAAMLPMADWPKQKGRKLGDCWTIQTPTGRDVRSLIIDVNTWKTRVTRGLSLPKMATSSIHFYRGDERRHREAAEQLLAEVPTRTEGHGRLLYEWKCPPHADNHLFDCLVGCSALASASGIERPGVVKRKRKRRRVSYG